MPRRKRKRRRPTRRHLVRRRADRWQELGKFGGLMFFVSTAILGQAELVGEPMRHYVTVVSIISLAVVAYTANPERMMAIIRTRKGR